MIWSLLNFVGFILFGWLLSRSRLAQVCVAILVTLAQRIAIDAEYIFSPAPWREFAQRIGRHPDA